MTFDTRFVAQEGRLQVFKHPGEPRTPRLHPESANPYGGSSRDGAVVEQSGDSLEVLLVPMKLFRGGTSKSKVVEEATLDWTQVRCSSL